MAAVLGGVIGFERERAHKVAGLRTHTLVAIGATLLSAISVYGFGDFSSKSILDPSRIISNIIVGIGFIGGGSILRRGSRVTGTTTAATLWLVAAIGIAVGIGFIYAALVTAAIGYTILTVLWQIEKKFIDKIPYHQLKENYTKSDNKETENHD